MLLFGMPPPRKPHPRSLDALFPRPRTVPKKAVKRCPNKHRQTASWIAGGRCHQCEAMEAERLRALQGAAEREEWRRRMGPAPAVLEMVETQTGRVHRFTIPRGLSRRRRPRDKARA